jgi:hypothetical protein
MKLRSRSGRISTDGNFKYIVITYIEIYILLTLFFCKIALGDVTMVSHSSSSPRLTRSMKWDVPGSDNDVEDDLDDADYTDNDDAEQEDQCVVRAEPPSRSYIKLQKAGLMNYLASQLGGKQSESAIKTAVNRILRYNYCLYYTFSFVIVSFIFVV